jgi:hypothetical protein
MAVLNKKEEVVKETVKVELPKEVELVIHEAQENAIIVNVDGWRMRVYFDEGTEKDKFRFGQSVLVKYLGDIENPHSIKFEKLK